jgi:hypothetical protein
MAAFPGHSLSDAGSVNIVVMLCVPFTAAFLARTRAGTLGAVFASGYQNAGVTREFALLLDSMLAPNPADRISAAAVRCDTPPTLRGAVFVKLGEGLAPLMRNLLSSCVELMMYFIKIFFIEYAGASWMRPG